MSVVLNGLTEGVGGFHLAFRIIISDMFGSNH